MESTTSFAASLLSSVSQDTDAAAQLANMAMVEMSDNANKMGTSMQDIQNAYQGFAKQNYTMLDNLKLGYGGTQAEMQAQHYPEVRLRVRMGVYAIEPGCLSASAAIDKANFARKQVHSNTRVSAVQFDKKLEVKQTLTGELLSGLPQALENGEFKLYLQPKFSPKDLSVIGAEALTRWIKPDGTVVYPDQFIPILESTGHIVELDLYIFEQVAQFLQRNAQAGHRLLPIAVNDMYILKRRSL